MPALVRKGSLASSPGKLLQGHGEASGVVAVDLRARRFLDGEAVHRRLAGRRPDSPWLAAHRARGIASVDVADAP
jgi:hypothetical protein